MPNNYVLLERIELNASAASITFANIPQSGYTDLKVVISARTNRSLEVDGINVSFNTGGTYSGRRLYGTGSGTGSDTTYAGMPFMTAATATANTFGNAEIYIPNYTSSTAKSFSIDGVGETNATTTYMGLGAGLWSGTAAITSIVIAPETGTAILAGSTFSLYGLAALGTTPTIAPKASGGNRIDYDGTYWYHTFLSSGTFTPQIGLTCDTLVIAGGGSGGSTYDGGGGGAGGLRGLSAQDFTINAFTIIVGAGGTNGTNNVGGNGSNSSIIGGALSISATGGGGGGFVSQSGGNPQFAGLSGGSGGGGQGSSLSGSAGGAGNAGSYSPVEGYAGSAGTNNAPPNYGSGAGGGAGAVGGTATGTSGGVGGVGSSAYSSWGVATNTGELVSSTRFYAGGGGGAAFSANAGAGGSGGGGAGSTGQGSAGIVNTGGGGGGSERNAGFVSGGAGGSGIVIIRYLAA